MWLEPTGSWRFTVHFRFEDKNGKHWLETLKDEVCNIIFFDDKFQAMEAGFIKALKVINL